MKGGLRVHFYISNVFIKLVSVISTKPLIPLKTLPKQTLGSERTNYEPWEAVGCSGIIWWGCLALLFTERDGLLETGSSIKAGNITGASS